MPGQNGRNKGAEKLTEEEKIFSSSLGIQQQKWGIYPDKRGKAHNDRTGQKKHFVLFEAKSEIFQR
jgi:hypothetical protein